MTSVDDQVAPPAPPPAGPRLGPVGWARFVWRRLTTMTTALLLLMLLAVAAVPGSVFPQRRIDEGRVVAYLADHPTSGPWLDKLGFFDVYAAPWFAAIYLLLFVSLVGCVLPRARVHAAAVRARPPRTPRRLAHLPVHRVARAGEQAQPEQVLDLARTLLRRGRYRVDAVPAGADDLGSVAAERGYAAETGNVLFHLSLLGVLIAVGVGSLYSWSGQVVVVVGKGFSDTRSQYDSFRAGTRVDTEDLPRFGFTLTDLVARFETEQKGDQFGAARYFRADLDVVDASGRTRKESIEVNGPKTVEGAKIYLVGNGYAPVVTVRDGRGDVAWSGPMPFQPQDDQYSSTGVIKVPDAQPRQLGFAGSFLPTAVFDPRLGPVSLFPDLTLPRLVLTAWAGDPGEDDLGVNDGRPQSIYTMDFSKVTQLRAEGGQPFRPILAPGESATLPDGAGTLTFDGVRRYAAFDIHHDPSKLPALISAGAALLGLVLSLYVRRRRVWVRVRRDGSGALVVEVAGLSPREDPRLERDLDQLVAALVPGVGEDGAQEQASEAEKGTA
ncbi:MAG: cytochrome c biogenesis protein ResB [Kineosporiaceae bacterium]